MERLTFVFIDRPHHTLDTYLRSVHARFVRLPLLPLHPLTALFSAFFTSFSVSGKYYVCESPISMLVPLYRRLLFSEKNRIIYRGADPLFDPDSTDYLATSNPMKRWVLRFLVGKMDGILAETNRIVDDARSFHPEIPAVLVPSFVRQYGDFKAVSPGLKEGHFVIVGDYIPPLDVKNTRFMLRMFSCLNSDKKLFVLGKNTPKLNHVAARLSPSIDIVGYESIIPYFEKSRFLLHLSRYESGPTVVLEAMAAGVLPIVSSRCGYAPLVRKIDPRLVIDLDKPEDTIISHLKDLDALSLSKIRVLSKKGRKLAEDYRMEKQIAAFPLSLEKLQRALR